MNEIQIKLFKDDKGHSTDTPIYQTEGSAGMDVHANILGYEHIGNVTVNHDELIIQPMARLLIHTGLYVAIPEGYELQVRPRSGQSLKKGILINNSPGTIDSDYRGEVGIIVTNFNIADNIVIKHNERIAQLILKKVERAKFIPVDNKRKLSSTDRGDGGFGSSGQE